MAWKIAGSYFETCSCDVVCPCTASLSFGATNDYCRVVLVFHVKQGEVEGTDVGGLTVAAVADTPKVMTEGNWRLGVFIDGAASDEQAEKLVGVFSGALGGPMQALGPLVGENLGVERAPNVPANRGAQPSELGQALAAARARLGLVALLFALAALAWWSTAERMAGMDGGPGADLGTLGWFLGVWVVMMAAMLFPSLAPTVALYARMTQRRGWSRPLLFSAGYLLVWGAAGLLAYGLFRLGRTVLGSDLAWHSGGRWFAG